MLTLVYRHFVVWGRHLWLSLALHLFAPLILLYGLGKVLEASYPLAYIVPGFMVNTALIGAYISCTYGILDRFFSKRYEGWLAANLSLPHILAADALFQVGRGLIVGTGVWLAGLAMGLEFSLLAWLCSLFVLALGVYISAAMGLAVVGVATSYDEIALSDPFMNAIFVFSGVFAAVSVFAEPLQWFATLFPVYHGIALIRPLFTHESVSFSTITLHFGVLLFQAGLFSWLALKSFERRLFA